MKQIILYALLLLSILGCSDEATFQSGTSTIVLDDGSFRYYGTRVGDAINPDARDIRYSREDVVSEGKYVWDEIDLMPDGKDPSDYGNFEIGDDILLFEYYKSSNGPILLTFGKDGIYDQNGNRWERK